MRDKPRTSIDRPAAREARRIHDEDVPAWELLESGRYMPRRTRGSLPGRELG